MDFLRLRNDSRFVQNPICDLFVHVKPLAPENELATGGGGGGGGGGS